MKIEIECPECGELLVGPSGNYKAELGEIVACREHGEIGMLEEVIVAASNKELKERPE